MEWAREGAAAGQGVRESRPTTPYQLTPVGPISPTVAQPKLLGGADGRDADAGARGGKALHGEDGVDGGEVCGNVRHRHAAQEPWGVPAVVEEFDMAHVNVGEQHYNEVDLRIVVDVDARPSSDWRVGTAADDAAGDSGECVGDDVGN